MSPMRVQVDLPQVNVDVPQPVQVMLPWYFSDDVVMLVAGVAFLVALFMVYVGFRFLSFRRRQIRVWEMEAERWREFMQRFGCG